MKSILLAVLMMFTLPAMAEIQTREISYEHDGAKLTGHLYWDDASEGKRPGVMVVHEWWGLNDYARKRARMLAELGYVAFAADMYGDGKVTDKAAQAKEWMQEVTVDVDAWRERAALGLEQLRNSDLVDAERLAAIGYCFGGATVFQMSYAGTDALGVVSFHGAMPAAPEESKGKISNRILAFHGAGDKFIAPEVVTNWQNKLQEAGADWELVIFGGDVRHGFTNEDAAAFGIDNLKYDARADTLSWERMQDFFSELFGG
ncbi:MAG: dienelactone hydrolase family protein [Gammaproteobacteria bacterium]|jgi:dienelactone hydrolase